MQAAGEIIEGFLEAVRVKEVWDHLTRYYLQVWGKHAHPTREVLDQELTERAELYICRPQ